MTAPRYGLEEKEESFYCRYEGEIIWDIWKSPEQAEKVVD